MAKITGKQCRQARSLLKWNLHDLASRVKSILARRIDSFEHGMVHLQPWENDELTGAFKKSGIVFKADLEVALVKERAEEEVLQASGMMGEGARIVLSADQVLLGADGKSVLDEIPRTEEEKRRDDKKGAV